MDKTLIKLALDDTDAILQELSRATGGAVATGVVGICLWPVQERILRNQVAILKALREKT